MLALEGGVHRCLACGEGARGESLLCPGCYSELRHSLHPRGTRCWRPQMPGLEIAAAGRYEHAWRRLLTVAKSQPAGVLPTPLALWMRALVLHWSAELRDWAADAVVWVPGHPLRSRLECDLARFTGEEIAADLRLPTAPSVLERPIRGWRHFWQAQKDRLRSERLHAARGLFRARRAGWPRGTRLLLVDDVTTTGGSLRACREALEDLGFEVAGAFVLAEVPAPKPGSG